MRGQGKEKHDNLATQVLLRGVKTDYYIVNHSCFCSPKRVEDAPLICTASISSMLLCIVTCRQGIQWPILSHADGRAISAKLYWKCPPKQARLARTRCLAQFAACSRNSRRTKSLMWPCISTLVSVRGQMILQAPSIEPLWCFVVSGVEGGVAGKQSFKQNSMSLAENVKAWSCDFMLALHVNLSNFTSPTKRCPFSLGLLALAIWSFPRRHQSSQLRPFRIHGSGTQLVVTTLLLEFLYPAKLCLHSSD